MWRAMCIYLLKNLKTKTVMKKFFGWMLILFAVGVAVTGFLLLFSDVFSRADGVIANGNSGQKTNEAKPKPGEGGRPFNFQKKSESPGNQNGNSNGKGGATEANPGNLADEVLEVIKTQAEQGANVN